MKNNQLGYLTATTVLAYDCPRKYYYEYVEGWKPVIPPANLVFGSILHESIAEEFRNGQTAEDIFLRNWEKTDDMAYSRSDTHESLRETGLALLDLIRGTEPYQRVVAVEKAYETRLPDGTVFKGKIDMIYDDGADEVVLDWKTAASPFHNSRPDLDDQLTAYSMLTGIPKVAYGVLLKKKKPEVRFFRAARTRKDYLDYQLKVMKVAADIEAGFFFRKPSMYCSFCRFCPLCRDLKERIEAELRQTPVWDRYKDVECEKVEVPLF